MGKVSVRVPDALTAAVIMGPRGGGQGPAELVGRYLVPARFTAVYEPSKDEPGYELDFVVPQGKAPECRAVRITATENGREVRGKDLATLNVANVLEWATARVAMVVRSVAEDGTTVADQPLDVAEMRPAIRQARSARAEAHSRINDEVLQEVARVYRACVDDRPTEAVAEHFGKKLRTASLYVRRARDRGFLGAAIPGKAGEQ